ncbi:MAG: hypothetical protein WBO36_09520 [Saprospiraceae bacterium]
MEIESVIKQARFKDGYQKAVINLLYTANYIRDAHMQIFSKYKIQGQHYNLLRILKGKHPEPVSPGYMKEVMLDKGRDLTRLIDKLVSLGWVHRCICPNNKRKMNVTLTPVGLQLLEKITQDINRIDDQMKLLSEEEYTTLSHLLDKMRG